MNVPLHHSAATPTYVSQGYPALGEHCSHRLPQGVTYMLTCGAHILCIIYTVAFFPHLPITKYVLGTFSMSGRMGPTHFLFLPLLSLLLMVIKEFILWVHLVVNCSLWWSLDGFLFWFFMDAVCARTGLGVLCSVSVGQLPGSGNAGAKWMPIFGFGDAAKLSSHRNSPI